MEVGFAKDGFEIGLIFSKCIDDLSHHEARAGCHGDLLDKWVQGK